LRKCVLFVLLPVYKPYKHAQAYRLWFASAPYVDAAFQQFIRFDGLKKSGSSDAFIGTRTGLIFQSRRGTPLSKDVVNQKHLYPILGKLGLEKGGMHGFRHHRVSMLVMSGVSKDVIKNQIGHGSDEMVKRYTHLRADFIESELDRVRTFLEIDPIDPNLRAVA
jgi:integrase